MKDSLFGLLLFPSGVFAIFFALILVSYERIVVARLQGRVGPPVYQNIIDFIKLFNKEVLIPHEASKFSFIIAPLLALAGMLYAIYLLPIPGVYAGATYNGDFLVLIYVLGLSTVSYAIAGGSSSSIYSAVSVSRIVTLTFCYELILFLVLTTISLAAGDGKIVFSFKDIINYQQSHGSFLFDVKMLPVVIAYIFFALTALEIPPFHISKNDADVMDGFLMEYSGRLLGFFETAKALKMLVVIILFQVLFLGGMVTDSLILNFFIFLMVSFALLIFFSFIHATIPSFRVDQAFKFLLIVPTILALISLVLVILSIKGIK